MKLSKIISEKAIQFEVNNKEFDLITLALDNYACFIEYSLKTKRVPSFEVEEEPIILTDKFVDKFIQQNAFIKPMLEIMHLFY